MAFSKILDSWRRLKIRSEASKRYKLWLRKSKLLLGAIFCYQIFNLADTDLAKENPETCMHGFSIHVLYLSECDIELCLYFEEI